MVGKTSTKTSTCKRDRRSRFIIENVQKNYQTILFVARKEELGDDIAEFLASHAKQAASDTI